jgi:hypothetical protein
MDQEYRGFTLRPRKGFVIVLDHGEIVDYRLSLRSARRAIRRMLDGS